MPCRLTRRPTAGVPRPTRRRWATESEPLAVLLLPARLEEFELREHAGQLLSIPRVVAVEPGRFERRRRLPAEVRAVRQARRLRFPGLPRVLVLYGPEQYPLARALAARHQAELWYVRQDRPEDELDRLARERAVATLSPSEAQPLRRRLLELDIISSRPFVPGGRPGRR